MLNQKFYLQPAFRHFREKEWFIVHVVEHRILILPLTAQTAAHPCMAQILKTDITIGINTVTMTETITQEEAEAGSAF
jgi:hypothetical protein